MQQNNSTLLVTALRVGAIFGLIVYGIFNSTNYAIFKDYPVSIGLIDTVWGMTAYTIATLVGLWYV